MQTGPKTAAGKQISSQNSLKHGVYARQIQLREEEKPGFALLEDSLFRQLKPKGALETEIFTRLLRVHWVTRRLDQREDQVFCDTGLPLCAAHPKEFENSLRYRRHLAKERRDLTAELTKLQTEAAIRNLGTDFTAFEQHSPLVDLRTLIELHNLRCATKNNGRPQVIYTAAPPLDEQEAA
ncbi:MAG: hypothetical protein K2Q23_08060 [Bryobacteraceae bacterium]|nr:hypothetical protein [Bryobacteraceae bacterium]